MNRVPTNQLSGLLLPSPAQKRATQRKWNYAAETISERIVRQLPPLVDKKRTLNKLEECNGKNTRGVATAPRTKQSPE
jgi:hypothetical protein